MNRNEAVADGERSASADAAQLRVLTLFRGSVPVACAMLLSIVLRVAVTALCTRLSSITDFGTYATVNAISGFISVLAMGGWPSYMLAVVPKYGLGASGLRAMRRRLARSCAALASAQSLFILFVVRSEGLWRVLLCAAMLLTGITFATVYNEVQRASGNILASRFALAVLPPLVTVAVITTCFFAGIEISAVVLLLSNAVGWTALWVFASARLRRVVLADEDAALRSVVSRRDLMLVKVSQAGLGAADVVAVGLLVGPVAGASYAVATRLAGTLGLGFTAVVMTYGPHLSKLADDRGALRAVSIKMTYLSIIISVPVAAAIILLRVPLLSLFGPGYAQAKDVLVVLLLGVLANAVCGPIGLAVNVSGQEALGRRVMMSACLVFLVLLAPAISIFGALGAAACWATVTLGWNLALWCMADFTHPAEPREAPNS